MNSRKTYCIISFIIVLLIQLSAGASTYIVFRYDDFSADGLGVRENNNLRSQLWEAEKEVDELFKKYGMSYVVSIIPKGQAEYGGVLSPNNTMLFSEDREKVEFVKNALRNKRIEVAQHGFSHTNHAGKNHRPGEFVNRDYESQLKDIKEGREILLNACGLSNISTFVPPWNAWNSDTAKILTELNFEILSADPYYYYKSAEQLKIIPFTATLSELEKMVGENNLSDEQIVVILYHPFDLVVFSGSEGLYFGVERFSELLQRLSRIEYVNVITLEQLVRQEGDLTIDRYRKMNKLWCHQSFWAKLLPGHFLPGSYDKGIYLSESQYQEKLQFWNLVTLAFVMALLISGTLSRYVIGLILSSKWCFRVDILAALLFCLSILAEFCLLQRGYHLTGIRAVPAFFTLFFVIKLLFELFRKAKPAKSAGMS